MHRQSSQHLGSARVLLEPGLWTNLRLSWRLLRDARVAPALKLFLPLAILLYLISPIDLVPDFLLGVGQVDDLGVLGATVLIAVRLLPRLAPRAVLSEHLQALGLVSPDLWSSPHARQSTGPVIETTYRVAEAPGDRRQRFSTVESELDW